jgi:hypothetical protein
MDFTYAWLGFIALLFVGLVVVCITEDRKKRRKK